MSTTSLTLSDLILVVTTTVFVVAESATAIVASVSRTPFMKMANVNPSPNDVENVIDAWILKTEA